MIDDNKTKKQLVHELMELRSQNAELKKSITGSLSAELTAEEASSYAKSIVETVRESLLVLDADLKIISANRNFYRTFKVTPGETIGTFIYDLGNKQWDIPKLRELLEEVLPEKEAFDDFEVAHNFQDIGHKIMLLNARQIYRKNIGTKMILLAIEEVTERKQLESLLEESEERYRRLFETASDGIVLLEKREGKITHANPATEKMLGYTREESIGNKLQDIGVLLDMGDFQTTMQNLNKIGILNYNGVQVKTKSGQLIDTDIYLVDRARLVQCNIRDITERKQAQDVLRQSGEYFKAIIQNSSDIILIVDRLGTITYASPSIERFLGYEPDEVIGKSSLDLIASDDKPRAMQDFGRALLAKDPTLNCFRIRHKNGTECILEGLGKNLLDNPIVAGFVMNVRDITERKKVENSLRESEERYHELTDFLPISFFEVDATGSIISFNRTALEVFRYNEEDYKESMNALQFFAPEEWHRVGENMGKVIQGTSIPGQEFTFLRKDGSKFIGLIYASPNIDQNKTVGIRGAIIDITERKQMEGAIQILAKFPSENPDPVLRIDRDGKLLYVNKSGLDQLPEWHLQEGQSVSSMLKDLVSETLNSGSRRIINLEHGMRTYSFSVAPISDADYTNLYGRDITEAKLAEEKLRESEGKYRNILESIEDGYFEVDIAGNLTFFNDSVCRMLGYTHAEMMGKNNRQYTDKENSRILYQAFNKVFRTEESSKGVGYEIIGKDGTKLYIESSVSLIKNTAGEPIGFRGIMRNITERKQAEKQLQETLESLRKAVGTTIKVMTSAVETRDPYTAGHQTRSADLARSIATEMGLLHEKIDAIRIAGSIHDIGKLSIPAEILSKPTKLSEIEFSLIKEHSSKGFEMLKDVESPWPLAEIVYQHHERMDGSGYPRNLKGEEICIEARILAVADVVEAMASHRPYRPGLGIDAALNEIEKNRGLFYDNVVVDACLRLFREKGFQLAEA